MTRLGPMVCGRLQDLLGQPQVLAELKADPGPLGLETLLKEIGKLRTTRSLGLDETLFAEVSDLIVAAWRARARRMYPSDSEAAPEPIRYTLLAALCWTRQAELVDGLVELLIGLIHKINARAERKVEKELIGELTAVKGKRGIFSKMVNAALEHPDDTVREAVFPVVPGGEKTLRALAKELMATQRAVAERVRYSLRGSYDQMIKYATALRLRTNETEQVLRRFMKGNGPKQPVYLALEELTCSSPRWCSSTPQLLQAVLRDPAWAGKLTDEDRRALSPLFWAHVNPYGRFRLDMDSRLDLGAAA